MQKKLLLRIFHLPLPIPSSLHFPEDSLAPFRSGGHSLVNDNMQLNKETRMSVALACAAALVGAALVVHAGCGNTWPSGNDAEVACHNCATDAWSTGSCTWHEAEAGDAYCGACQTGYNCGTEGSSSAQKVTTYTNGMCSATGCIGGGPPNNWGGWG